MNVLLTLSAHFVRDPAGATRALSPPMDYAFFRRYLEVFEEVTVVARTAHPFPGVEEYPRADGEGVRFLPLPDFRGPWQYLGSRGAAARCLREALGSVEAVCLRVPCPIGTLAWRTLRARGRPFGVEVVGDPWDVFSAGAVRSIVRPFVRRLFARALRLQCREAAVAAYVTRSALQRRYPAGRGTFATWYSGVALSPGDFADQPRVYRGKAKALFLAGTLETLYKGVDVLLGALSRCAASGLELELRVAGDGRYRPDLVRLGEALGVGKRVAFLGLLRERSALLSEFDRADIFLLPSRTEGLPRALIEAMARGLPCVASAVGGIPELLLAEDLVPPGDPEALARKIREVAEDPARMSSMSARNLETAREYSSERLQPRRFAFYRELRRRTEEWLRRGTPELAWELVPRGPRAEGSADG